MWPVLLWGKICIFFFCAPKPSNCYLTAEESRFATNRIKEGMRVRCRNRQPCSVLCPSPLCSVPQEVGSMGMSSVRFSGTLWLPFAFSQREAMRKSLQQEIKGRRRETFACLFPKLPPVGLAPGSG